MRIDFVSDVACPWCAVGLNALERALERIGGELGTIELHMQPFELNPTMPPEGANAAQYLKDKYGLSDEQLAWLQSELKSADEAGAPVLLLGHHPIAPHEEPRPRGHAGT